MAVKLAKKPLSEGFDLWDRGYFLGAMRLFIFKAETLPPFQIAGCLDAMAHLLLRLEEVQDARDNFNFAAEKYELIQQPIVHRVMQIKGIEAMEGTDAALKEMQSYIDGDFNTHRQSEDPRTPLGIGRAYHYYAELLASSSSDTSVLQQALNFACQAVTFKFDRYFLGFLTIGDIQLRLGNSAAAEAAFREAIATNANCIAAYENLIALAQGRGDNAATLQLLTHAIELHPKSSFIRDKAFLLAESGNDVEALSFLDRYIADPPHEETEALVMGGSSSANLLKAKAAILADLGRMPEAAAAAREALKNAPNDEEAQRLVADIETSS